MTNPEKAMSRGWTVEGLNRVHPLPEGWGWSFGKCGQLMAVEIATGLTISVDADGDLDSDLTSPPADVCLAVILASKGLDSLAEMADAMQAWADAADEQAFAADQDNMREARERLEGESQGIERCAAMLRRGTVQP